MLPADPAADPTVPALAARAGMSERGSLRHHRAETGQTPARMVERLRVEAARGLLADTRLPVKRVTARCDFGSEETMRRAFLRLLAATPQAYRERFAAAGPAAGADAPARTGAGEYRPRPSDGPHEPT